METVEQVPGIRKGAFETFDGLMEFLLGALEWTLPDSIFRRWDLSPLQRATLLSPGGAVPAVRAKPLLGQAYGLHQVP